MQIRRGALGALAVVVALQASATTAHAEEERGNGTAPAPYTTAAPPYASPYAPSGGWAAPGPKQMNYDEGAPIPAGYHLEKRTRKGRVVGGSIMFGVAYFASLIASAVAADSNDRGYWPLAIPAIGPFMTMATANTPLIQGDSAPGVLLLIDGALQCGGLVLAVLGFTDKKTMLIRNDLGLSVTPMLARGVTGIGVSFAL